MHSCTDLMFTTIPTNHSVPPHQTALLMGAVAAALYNHHALSLLLVCSAMSTTYSSTVSKCIITMQTFTKLCSSST